MSSKTSSSGFLEYVKLGTRGLVLDALPGIVKGIMNQALTLQQVDTKKAIEWVERDERMLAHVGLENNQGIRSVLGSLGVKKLDLSWATTPWLLEGIRSEHPALYSLMMGWPKGRAWCDRQVAEIKSELEKMTTHPA